MIPDGWSILVSCFDAEDTVGGGLFVFGGESVGEVDRISTTGLDYADGRLIRCLWSDVGDSAELLVYDERGLLRYQRLDAVTNPHDVRWEGDNAAVVATAENRVVWVSPGGETVRTWQPPGEPDSWHLNGLVHHEGKVLVCAFGRFSRRKGWDEARRPATGCLVDISSGEIVVTGLRAPHSPRFHSGSWIICNSDAGSVLEIDAGTGSLQRSAELGDWPRGLARSERALFVGVSPRRRDASPTTTSRIYVLDVSTWETLDVIPVPAREIYDLLLVPNEVVHGVERACGVNATREREQGQRLLFDRLGIQPTVLWAVGDVLPPDAHRVTIRPSAAIPDVAEAGSLIRATFSIHNRGSSILTPAPPYPVRVVYGWLNTRGHPGMGEMIPSRLPCSLPPGEEIEVPVLVRVPSTPGRFRLHVTLEQQGVGRFDSTDRDSVLECEIHVE